MESTEALAQTRRWVREVVVGLDLCPFAAEPLESGAVRFALSRGEGLAEVLAEVLEEARRMAEPGGARTALLVIPSGFDGFDGFLDLLDAADLAGAVLAEHGLGDQLQLVAFHPDWQAADVEADDPANATNRSPHPMLHLLRNADVAHAERTHPDVGGIPARNAALLRALARGD